jgi:preprotein translocase subunit SecD
VRVEVPDRRWAVEPWSEKDRFCAVLLHPTQLGNADIVDAKAEVSVYGYPQVNVVFSDAGAKRFADLTAANVDGRLAILRDGEVMSAPVIKERIGGGRAQISMGSAGDALRDARILAAALRAGPLTSPVKLVSVHAIGSP